MVISLSDWMALTVLASVAVPTALMFWPRRDRAPQETSE